MPRPKTPRGSGDTHGGEDSNRTRLELRKLTKGQKYPELDFVASYITFGKAMTNLFSLFQAGAASQGVHLNLSRPLRTQRDALESVMIDDLDLTTDEGAIARAAAYTIGTYAAVKRLATAASKESGLSPYRDSNHNLQKWENYNEAFEYWWDLVGGVDVLQDAHNADWFPVGKGSVFYIGRYIGAIPTIRTVLDYSTGGITRYVIGGSIYNKGRSDLPKRVKSFIDSLTV